MPTNTAASTDAGSTDFLLHDPALLAVPITPTRRLSLVAGTGGRGELLARLWDRYGGLLEALAERVGIEVAAAVAIVSVESGGRAFGDDGRLLVRFEPHVFARYLGTGRRREFDAHFRLQGRVPWEGHSFRAASDAPWRPFHGAQRTEWEALDIARRIDDDLALRSTSMGLAQVMGFNHARVGHRSPRSMFDALSSDVRYHLLAMFDFVRGTGRDSRAVDALRREDYVAFARTYNGSGHAGYYGALIEADVAAFRALRAPGAARTYTVVAGDTLSRIGRRFGVSVVALVRANAIEDPDLIRVGQRLTIPPS